MKVKNLELAQEHLELIKKIIRSDKKFENNEDLFDDFFNETCKRTLSVIETIDDTDALEAYLRKIASTSIVMVLKDLGRVRRTQTSYVSTSDVITAPVSVNPCAPDYSNEVVSYDFISIKPSPEEIVVKKELLQSVYDAVLIAHGTNIEKQYLQLYELRYVEGKKQADIAREMNISQSQVSKRLFELMDIVRKAID